MNENGGGLKYPAEETVTFTVILVPLATFPFGSEVRRLRVRSGANASGANHAPKGELRACTHECSARSIASKCEPMVVVRVQAQRRTVRGDSRSNCMGLCIVTVSSVFITC